MNYHAIVANRDRVDRDLEIWARELPELDLPTEALVSRIWMLAKHFERSLDETAHDFGLNIGEWRTIAALRAEGAPYRVPAGRLAERQNVSPAAMTARIDGLEARGLVRRVGDPSDRRVSAVELTEDGRRMWDEAVGVQARKEQLVAAALTERQRDQLNELLRRLTLSFEATEDC